MYCIVLTPNDLWSDEVSNHEEKRQHKHFHKITNHLGMFLTINVNFVEVGSILNRRFESGGIKGTATSVAVSSFELNHVCCCFTLASGLDSLSIDQTRP
jgi:hypothetical protein